MLGFAFSEAQRSEELMRRLQEQKGNSPISTTAATAAAGGPNKQHKRTRRRRRAKKPLGGASSIGNSTATTSASTTYVGGAKNLASSSSPPQGATRGTAKKQHDAPMTRRDLYFSLRCGIVQVGPCATDTAVGRVTLVNWESEIVVDTFVKVPVPVTDYRTEVTGITPNLLGRGACSLDTIRKKVASLIRGKILIGHGLEVDLAALHLSHPLSDMRDTATYPPFMQQTMDPTTHMSLPRTLEDLMQHALKQPVLPGQPLLVSEAIACLSLYKAVREQWERELILSLQQKERQRQLVLNMRSAPGLSRIAEDAVGDEVGAPTDIHAQRHLEGMGYDRFNNWRDSNNEYESSTLASDRTMFDNYESCRDDVSETSSFVTSDMKEMEADLNPLFENLQLLPEFNQHLSGNIQVQQQQTLGSSTTAGSQLEDWTTTRGSSLGTSEHSGIWSPLPPSSAVNSVTTVDWSHDSPQAMVHPQVSLEHNSNSLNAERSGVAQMPPVSLTEEELREHLPSHLLDDLDGTLPQHTTSLHKEDKDEPKKKSWFGLGRRLRSMSASSPGEASFAELKAGSRLSLSDRIPRRTRLLGDDSHESSRSTDNKSLPRHTDRPPGL